MASTSHLDGVLVQWGDRLFYPGNREVSEVIGPPAPQTVPKKHVALAS